MDADDYHLDPSATGYLLGAVGIPATVLGAFLWPSLVGWRDRGGKTDGLLFLLTCAILVGMPFFVLAPIAGSIV